MGCSGSKMPEALPWAPNSRPSVAKNPTSGKAGLALVDADDPETLLVLLESAGSTPEKRMLEIAKHVVEFTKTSDRGRRILGTKCALKVLTSALTNGSPATKLAAAEAIANIAFCKCHDEIAESGALKQMVDMLNDETYRLTVFSLMMLCNMSTSPSWLVPLWTHPLFLPAMKRFLLQSLDVTLQSAAAQVMLNMCCSIHKEILPVAVDRAKDREVSSESHELGSAYAVSASTADGASTGTSFMHPDPPSTPGVLKPPTSHASCDADSCWSEPHGSRGGQHLPTNSGSGSTHTNPLNGNAAGEDVLSRGNTDQVTALMGVLIPVLQAKVDVPDRETRNMAIEALLHMCEQSEANTRVFIRRNGLLALVRETRRADVLMCSLVLIADILMHVVRSGRAQEVFGSEGLAVISRMMSTHHTMEDRVLDVDAKLSALKLASELFEAGTGRQQTSVAHEVVQHFPTCLASSSVPLHLSTCRLMISLCDNSHARGALASAPLIPSLVAVNSQHQLLSSAPVIHAISRLSRLSRCHADAVIRCKGLEYMLETLENSTIAKAQRHALVATTQVLKYASPAIISPVLQTGNTLSVVALVLQHTGSGPLSDQSQWVAWCCRALALSAKIDENCKAKVVSTLCRPEEPLLQLLHLQPRESQDPDKVVRTLSKMAAKCDETFLSKVEETQKLAEIIATMLVRGKHPALTNAVAMPGCTGNTLDMKDKRVTKKPSIPPVPEGVVAPDATRSLKQTITTLETTGGSNVTLTGSTRGHTGHATDTGKKHSWTVSDQDPCATSWDTQWSYCREQAPEEMPPQGMQHGADPGIDVVCQDKSDSLPTLSQQCTSPTHPSCPTDPEESPPSVHTSPTLPSPSDVPWTALKCSTCLSAQSQTDESLLDLISLCGLTNPPADTDPLLILLKPDSRLTRTACLDLIASHATLLSRLYDQAVDSAALHQHPTFEHARDALISITTKPLEDCHTHYQLVYAIELLQVLKEIDFVIGGLTGSPIATCETISDLNVLMQRLQVLAQRQVLSCRGNLPSSGPKVVGRRMTHPAGKGIPQGVWKQKPESKQGGSGNVMDGAKQAVLVNV